MTKQIADSPIKNKFRYYRSQSTLDKGGYFMFINGRATTHLEGLGDLPPDAQFICEGSFGWGDIKVKYVKGQWED